MFSYDTTSCMIGSVTLFLVKIWLYI